MSHSKPLNVDPDTSFFPRRWPSRGAKCGRSLGSLPWLRWPWSSRSLLFLAGLLIPALAATAGGSLPGPLPLLPADNWWNQDVSAAPLDPDSAAFISFIGSTRALHPDFGGEESPGSTAIYGMPYIVVNASQAKRAVAFDYADESDGVDHGTGLSYPFYPIPDEAIAQPHWIEGGYPGNENVGGDRHMLIVDSDNKYLYELFSVRYSGGQWFAGSGAFFDLNVNGRRPDGWTSADAAGLAILPGLVRYDEVYGPDEIRHAFRFTVRATNGYVWPASHRAGSTPGALPMGARLRLKASKDISAFDPFMQKIFRAMKTYGLIVADNGSDMFITGTFDTRWNNDILNPAFGALRADDFEVIQLGWQPSPAPTPTFADVPFGHPYYDEIEWLYRNGYTSGCATDPLRYCPDATMNRAESAVFVERGIHTASYDPPAPISQIFADLPLDSWAAGWVNGLWEDQYTAGCGTDPLVYCPWQGHTRAEGAVFYLRMLNGASYVPPDASGQTFVDVPMGTWYANWIEAAYSAGLIEVCGTQPLRYCPEDSLSRAVAAYMMVHAKGPPLPEPTPTPVPTGNTYYVSTAGNDSSPGTAERPFRTIQRGIDALQPGDTCRVAAGTYNEALVLKRSGIAGKRIEVIADGTVTINSGSARSITVQGDAGYVEFDGIRFLSNYTSGASILLYYNWVGEEGTDSHNNGFVFRNCYIEGAISIYGANNLIENCELNGRGIWATGILERFKPSHDNTYRNNTIHDYTGRGVWSMQRTRNPLIEGNTIYNIAAGYTGSDRFGIDCDGAASPVYNCDVINNRIYDMGGEAGVLMENAFDGSEVRGNSITNMSGDGIGVINYGPSYADGEYRDDDTGMVIEGNILNGTGEDGIICHSASGIKVKGNTFQNTNRNRSYFGAIGLVPDGGYACNDWEVTENTFTSPAGYALFFEGNPSGIASDYNNFEVSVTARKFVLKSGAQIEYTFSQWQGLGYDTHSILGGADWGVGLH